MKYLPLLFVGLFFMAESKAQGQTITDSVVLSRFSICMQSDGPISRYKDGKTLITLRHTGETTLCVTTYDYSNGSIVKQTLVVFNKTGDGTWVTQAPFAKEGTETFDAFEKEMRKKLSEPI
jgi:hypothetical protein